MVTEPPPTNQPTNKPTSEIQVPPSVAAIAAGPAFMMGPVPGGPERAAGRRVRPLWENEVGGRAFLIGTGPASAS